MTTKIIYSDNTPIINFQFYNFNNIVYKDYNTAVVNYNSNDFYIGYRNQIQKNNNNSQEQVVSLGVSDELKIKQTFVHKKLQHTVFKIIYIISNLPSFDIEYCLKRFTVELTNKYYTRALIVGNDISILYKNQQLHADIQHLQTAVVTIELKEQSTIYVDQYVDDSYKQFYYDMKQAININQLIQLQQIFKVLKLTTDNRIPDIKFDKEHILIESKEELCYYIIYDTPTQQVELQVDKQSIIIQLNESPYIQVVIKNDKAEVSYKEFFSNKDMFVKTIYNYLHNNITYYNDVIKRNIFLNTVNSVNDLVIYFYTVYVQETDLFIYEVNQQEYTPLMFTKYIKIPQVDYQELYDIDDLRLLRDLVVSYIKNTYYKVFITQEYEQFLKVLKNVAYDDGDKKQKVFIKSLSFLSNNQEELFTLNIQERENSDYYDIFIKNKLKCSDNMNKIIEENNSKDNNNNKI